MVRDGKPKPIAGQGQFAESAARPRRQPADIVGDFRKRNCARSERTTEKTDRIPGGLGLKMIGCLAERQAGPRRQVPNRDSAKFGRRVQTGSDRRSAQW